LHNPEVIGEQTTAVPPVGVNSDAAHEVVVNDPPLTVVLATIAAAELGPFVDA
jgi:hypothetical protein